MRHLEERAISRHGAHGEWNCAIRPAPAGPPPEPPPPPAPAPDLEALAAPAGITDLAALLEAVTVPWQAAREQRLHLTRGHARLKDSGCPLSLTLAAVITAAACRHRLAMTYRELGRLLHAGPSTIRLSVSRLSPILEQHGITQNQQRHARER